MLSPGDGGKLRVLFGGDAHNREFAGPALDHGDVLFIHRKLYIVPGQAAGNVAEKPGAQDHGPGFLHRGGDAGGHAQLQVKPAEGELVPPGLQKDAFQGGDGGFCGNGPLYVADCFHKLLPVANNLHSMDYLAFPVRRRGRSFFTPRRGIFIVRISFYFSRGSRGPGKVENLGNLRRNAP